MKLKDMLYALWQGGTPELKRWSNVATPTTGRYYEVARFTLKPYSKYLFLGWSNNNMGSQVDNSLRFNKISGDTVELFTPVGNTRSGSGNNVITFAYVETDSQSVMTAEVYGYNATVTNILGGALAIKLGGGVLRKSILARGVAA